MVNYELLKCRLSMVIPLQNKIRSLEQEIDMLQTKIDDLASIPSIGFEERLGGNPIPKDEIMTSLISEQWDLERESKKLRQELFLIKQSSDECPDFVKDHYYHGTSWKDLERIYGKSRQLMDYEFNKSVIS